MNIRLLIATALALALHGSADARDWPAAGNWRVYEVDDESCAIHQTYPDRSQLYLILSTDDSALLALAKPGWSIEQDKKYDVAYRLDDIAFDGAKALGTTVSDGPVLVSYMDAGFLSHFASAHSVKIFRDSALLGDFTLAGSGAALATVNKCVASLKAKAKT
jgi:hypothetical protein